MSGFIWSPPKTTPPPLPSHINRSFVPTPNGNLELLSALPASTSPNSPRPPFFFCHGGFGSAAVWIEYMTYFSQKHDIPCYAISLRGHGSSWYPSFLRMVYFTSKRMLADDLVAGVHYVQEAEKHRTGHTTDVVLAGHSSGGGLSQLVLSEGDVSVRGLVLVAATPCFGQLGVYWNWAKLDPWFSIRMYWHLMHPRSPLSSIPLIKGAFFCKDMPEEKVSAFEKFMAPYESFIWAIGMMRRNFIKVKNVIQHISGWGTGERILVMAGSEDKLMGVKLMQQMADQYRAGFSEVATNKKIEAKSVAVQGEQGVADSGQGVRFYVVRGAGHHLQNDLRWEDGAVKMLEFYEQL